MLDLFVPTDKQTPLLYLEMLQVLLLLVNAFFKLLQKSLQGKQFLSKFLRLVLRQFCMQRNILCHKT